LAALSLTPYLVGVINGVEPSALNENDSMQTVRLNLPPPGNATDRRGRISL